MLTTSARLLELLSLLHRRRFWTGPELADTLGVTTRSVRRDVDRLRALGYPVQATGGVGGGYALGAGSELPPLPLDDEEAVAVAVGLRAAATGVVSGLEQASLRALAKLEQVLPRRLHSQVRALNAVSVRMADGVEPVDAEVLSRLAQVCREEQRARFVYRDRTGSQTQRTVEPYRLVHTSARWYLLAFDLDRQDWRTFRVDRLAGPPSALHRFAPRPLPAEDVGAWVADHVRVEGRNDLLGQIVVHAPAEAVSTRLLGRWGRVEARTPTSCLLLLACDRDHLEWLAASLGWLGFDFEVLGPPALVEAVARVGARLLRSTQPQEQG